MVDYLSPTRVSLWADFKARLLMHGIWMAAVIVNWCVGEVYYV